ncbi:MAG: hypothetical protein QOF98_1319 [Streptomyces sp.]|nr:hypothetical protein [Streptomyces sp.]
MRAAFGMTAAAGMRVAFGMRVSAGTWVAFGTRLPEDAPPHAPELRMKDVRRR